MLLERKIIAMLNNYNIYKGTISRGDFVDYVISKKWPRINYVLFCRWKAFKRRLEIAIDDCIKRKFMEDSGNIKATEKGRDYIKILGFIEEFLKRRKRTVVNTLLIVSGVLITYIVNFFM